MNKLAQYAVFGNPIAQSKSPWIHTSFAQRYKQDLTYVSQCVANDGFEQAATEFFATGGSGLNITTPFKQDAYNFASVLTERARCAEAVNTLMRQHDGSILGDTTDGDGLAAAITQDCGCAIQEKRVLIIGAGGAVRGVLQPLLENQPAKLVIANRTAEKAQRLASAFSSLSDKCTVQGVGLDQLHLLQGKERAFDIVINGTSAQLMGSSISLPAWLFSAQTLAYDMSYSKTPSAFMLAAKEQGAMVSDGLSMLVYQAAAAFSIWRDAEISATFCTETIEKLRLQL